MSCAVLLSSVHIVYIFLCISSERLSCKIFSGFTDKAKFPLNNLNNSYILFADAKFKEAYL